MLGLMLICFLFIFDLRAEAPGGPAQTVTWNDDEEVCQRALGAFDRDGDGRLSPDEFLDYISKTEFEADDLDHNGYIDLREFTAAIKACSRARR